MSTLCQSPTADRQRGVFHKDSHTAQLSTENADIRIYKVPCSQSHRELENKLGSELSSLELPDQCSF